MRYHKYHNIMRNRIKIGLWLLLSLAFPAGVFGGEGHVPEAGVAAVRQQRDVIIKGRVTDRSGEALPGASILVEGTSTGTVTDVNGNYFLQFVPRDNQKLIVSYVGYQTKTVVYKGERIVDVVLDMGDISLDDVVVIGYGSKQRKSLTSSVVSMREADVDRLASTATTMDNLLGGTMKGVLATTSSGEPGAALRINVRGITSPYPKKGGGTSNVPLYVIDGVPMFMEDTALNPLLGISPNDIESIDVLKDASATAIYGSRGANGVIIVNTKNGRKGEKMNIEAGYTFSVSNAVKDYDRLNTEEFKNLQAEILSNTARAANQGFSIAYDPMMGMMGMADYTLLPLMRKFGNFSVGADGTLAFEGIDPALYGVADTDWTRQVRNKNAATHQYNVAVRGGSERTNYSFSFNGINQEGLLINDRMERYGARLSMDTEINNCVSFGSALNYSYSNRKSGSNMDVLGYDNNTWQTRPDLTVRDGAGRYSLVDAAGIYGSEGVYQPNPVAKLQRKATYVNDQFLGNAYIEVKPLSGLTLRGDFNVARYAFKTDYFTPLVAMERQGYSPDMLFDAKSILTSSRSTVTTTSINLRADYKKKFGLHNAGVMAGYGADRYWSELHAMSYAGFPNDCYLDNPASAADVTGYTDTYSKSGLNSLYGRLSYDYDARYLVEVSMRADASSKFGPDNRWGVFPAVSLGWRINNEAFLKDVSWIDDLKLRLSWGKTGSTNVADFAYTQLFNGGKLYGGQSAVTLEDTFPNVEIGWEMTTEYNLGLDFAFFGGKLDGSIDLYHRYTDGALAPAPIGLEFGIPTYYSNIIDLLNRGVEFAVGGDVVRTRQFTWNSRFNIATNRSKIDRLNGAALDMFSQDKYPEGKPVGTVMGYKVDGIYQNWDQIDELNAKADANFNIYQAGVSPGDYRMADTDGNGYISEADRVPIANPEPECFGGWTNTFTYKNLSLSALFQYQCGGEGVYMTLNESASGALGQSVLRELYGNTWTPERPDARYAQLVFMPTNYDNTSVNDRYVFSTAYLRLKNITLSYALPVSWTQRWGVADASLFCTATNLFTVTSWPGLDPEMLSTGYLGNTESRDLYPMSRSFSLGVKISF